MTNARSTSSAEDICAYNDIDDSLLTNIGYGVWGFGVVEYDRQACMREAVRLYGRHFGVEISEVAYDRNGRLIAGYISLHVTGGRRDLSEFWRLHEALSFEVAKA